MAALFSNPEVLDGPFREETHDLPVNAFDVALLDGDADEPGGEAHGH
jgi:hypothetical protein